MPPAIDAVGPAPDANLTPIPETISPVPAGSNLPVVQKKPLSPRLIRILVVSGLIVSLIGLLTFGLMGRRIITETWPKTDAFYDAVGFHIYHYGEGLSFVGVRSELRYDNGKMVLAVEGKVHNGSANVQDIPLIVATAMGVDSKTVQSWQITPPAGRVQPGDEVDFHSSIDAPKDAVAEINLNFVEMKHDDDQ